MPRPPRIVILDNDQTTGDFTSLFYWFDWLKKSELARYITLQALIEPFLNICEFANIIRPGLRQLISRLNEMKEADELDYVVVYTNQSEPNPLMLGKDGTPITIPRILEQFYNYMADGNILVDLLLVRPSEYNYVASLVPKQFKRVFAELGIDRRYWNAKYTRFFDDVPHKFILDDEILGADRAHVRVDTYRTYVEPSILLELCLVTLRIADSNNAKRGVLTNAIRHIHDLLLRYRKEESGSTAPVPALGGGGLGHYFKYLEQFYEYG